MQAGWLVQLGDLSGGSNPSGSGLLPGAEVTVLPAFHDGRYITSIVDISHGIKPLRKSLTIGTWTQGAAWSVVSTAYPGL